MVRLAWCGTSSFFLSALIVVAIGGCGNSPGLSSCDGADPTPGPGVQTCRASTDCSGGQSCLAPGQSAGCGVCRTPFRTCESDADCAATDFCLEFVPACSCGGQSSECVPRCMSDAECGADKFCDAGQCAAVPCSDPAYDCAVNARCATTGGDAHGCYRLTCDADADCDCGACVSGGCYETVGHCSAEVP